MSVEWDRTRLRQRVLRAAVDDVASSGDPAAIHRHPIVATFGDLDSFLLAVHARWATAVLTRADAVLEDDPADPATALAQQLEAPFAGTRLLLDAHATSPPLVAARAQLRSRVLADLGVDLADLPAPVGPRRRSFCVRTLVLGRRLSPAS